MSNPVAMVAPSGESMSRDPVDLTLMHAACIHQEFQGAESVAAVVGVPYEQKNRYRISAVPEDKRVATSPNDNERWKPSSKTMQEIPLVLYAREESSCLERVFLNFLNIGNLRNMKMHLQGADGRDDFLMLRPFNCGAWICCPIKSTLYQSNGQQPTRKVGKIIENWNPYCLRCCEAVCLCTTYTDVHQFYQEKNEWDFLYQIKTNVCCFGPHNNFCGATPFKNDMVFNVTDRNGQVVAHIQKTYGSGDSYSQNFCRCCFQFSNYLISFPADSTQDQRALLLSAALHFEYVLFEKSGDENN